jgi:hypothetical protein
VLPLVLVLLLDPPPLPAPPAAVVVLAPPPPEPAVVAPVPSVVDDAAGWPAPPQPRRDAVATQDTKTRKLVRMRRLVARPGAAFTASDAAAGARRRGAKARAARYAGSPMGEAAEERRRARAETPIVRTTLGEEGRSAAVPGTPSERVAMVERLTMEAWAMSGRPLPSYARAEAPGRLVRRGA